MIRLSRTLVFPALLAVASLAPADPARLIEAGRCREAVALLEATPQVAEAGADVRTLLARAYLGVGRPAEAEAIAAKPGPPAIESDRLAVLARAAEARGDLDRAISLMTDAVEARRTSLASVESLDGASALAGSRTLLGALAFRAGRLDLAKAQFQAAVTAVNDAHARLHAQDVPHDERDPRLMADGATAGLAQVYEAQGDNARADRSWRAVMARTDDPAILLALARSSQARNDARSAQRHRDRAWKLTADKPAHRLTRALLMADDGKTRSAAQQLAEAAFDDGPGIAARDTLAWVLHQQGNDRPAREILQPVLDLGSKDPRVWFHAGVIAQTLGDRETARKLLAGSLATNPGFDPIDSREATRRLKELRETSSR